MRAIDLFCGAGGLTLGLRRAGWNVVAGIDVDSQVEATYRSNNPGTRFVATDLRNVTEDDIRALAKATPGSSLLLAGCAPCQPFSKQRQRHGLATRSDATLLGEFARLVRTVKPGVVLMENVPGVASVPGFSSFRRFLRTLHDDGYSCDHGVLNARDFNVPQHRRRYVLLAARTATAVLPRPSLQDSDTATVRSAIGHFPALGSGETHASVPNHCAARLSVRNLQRVKATPPDGGSRRDWPKRLRLDCHAQIRGFSDVYGRLWWDRIAPTLTSRCNSLSNGRFGHPEQDRAISLREAAALQTFPDDYEFFGSMPSIARWIGNAVPVAFAEALGRAALRIAA